MSPPKSTESPPDAPKHLRPETRKWWARVVAAYTLEEHHLKLLTLAASAWDRCQHARQAIAEAGAYYEDRFGQPRVHPAVAVERESHRSFMRTIRELGLDLAGDADQPTRPPIVQSKRS